MKSTSSSSGQQEAATEQARGGKRPVARAKQREAARQRARGGLRAAQQAAAPQSSEKRPERWRAAGDAANRGPRLLQAAKSGLQ